MVATPLSRSAGCAALRPDLVLASWGADRQPWTACCLTSGKGTPQAVFLKVEPRRRSGGHRFHREQHLKSKNYFGPAAAPTNGSLSGPTACDGVGAAGGVGSEIFWRTSCSAACSSTWGEGATTALGAIMPEASASRAGASQPNCSDQFAIIFLAALPYDCQPDVAATPRQNAITKRKMVRPRDGGLLDTRAFSRSR